MPSKFVDRDRAAARQVIELGRARPTGRVVCHTQAVVMPLVDANVASVLPTAWLIDGGRAWVSKRMV
jgi:hypothetical protein